MNDGKMYQVPEDMECQHVTEDSKIRLYLSAVRHEETGGRKETTAEKIMAAAVALPYSVFITYEAGKWMVDSAARSRGYDAIGGEYILIVMVFMASFRLIWGILRGKKGRKGD